MPNTVPTADQALLRMFSTLMSNEVTVPVAEALRDLCMDIPGDRTRSGDMIRIVMTLRARYPEHDDLILKLSMEM